MRIQLNRNQKFYIALTLIIILIEMDLLIMNKSDKQSIIEVVAIIDIKIVATF